MHPKLCTLSAATINCSHRNQIRHDGPSTVVVVGGGGGGGDDEHVLSSPPLRATTLAGVTAL